jgi:hypothetical protein
MTEGRALDQARLCTSNCICGMRQSKFLLDWPEWEGRASAPPAGLSGTYEHLALYL